jgi:cytochrome P450
MEIESVMASLTLAQWVALGVALVRSPRDLVGAVTADLGEASVCVHLKDAVQPLPAPSGLIPGTSPEPGVIATMGARGLTAGSFHADVLKMHEKYGQVVRIAPGELAFISPGAWKDISGHRPTLAAGNYELPKHGNSYRIVPGMPTSIASAEYEEHTFLRKGMSRGFSEKSMQDQEPIIGQYVDLLITRLRDHCAENDEGERKPRALDMTAWYNYTTFDIIGDLAFGEPFGCLENAAYHAWVKAVQSTVIQMAYLQALTALGFRFVIALAIRVAMKARHRLHDMTKGKLMRRIEAGKERPDLIEGLVQMVRFFQNLHASHRRTDKCQNLEIGKIQTNASTLIIAGSETTATLLSGVTFLPLMNPACLERATQEVRTQFKSEHDIKLTTVGSLTYMLACLNEALRCYSPVASGLAREVPKGGATIAGHFIPEGVSFPKMSKQAMKNGARR